MTNGNGAPPSGAMVKRTEQVGAVSLTTTNETASTAMAAQVKAAEEASYIMAMRQPRDLDDVRSTLLKECQRPSFAAVARYRKPIGAGIEGLSIRFVEQAIQILGNIKSSQITVYDDEEKRIVAVTVTDYERNASHTTQITVNKTVERNQLRRGQTAIGRRTGSSGQVVYIVRATDDDLLNKQGSLVSKAIRTNGLRLIPGWLQDEATEAIKRTAGDQAAKDPDAERKALADAFMALNINPGDLAEYLGHDLGKVSPPQLVELREVYTTIRDGQTTWQDTLEHRLEQRGEQAAEAAPAAAKPEAKGVAAVKAKLAKRPAATSTAAPAPQEQAPPREVMQTQAVPTGPVNLGEVAPTTEQRGTGYVQVRGEPATEAAAPPKRASRSKAAQAERAEELATLVAQGVVIASKRKAQLYIQGGDPRNKAKALAGPQAKTEEPAPDPMDDIEPPAPTTQAQPGQLAPGYDDEPPWMSGNTTPPPDEEF